MGFTKCISMFLVVYSSCCVVAMFEVDRRWWRGLYGGIIGIVLSHVHLGRTFLVGLSAVFDVFAWEVLSSEDVEGGGEYFLP